MSEVIKPTFTITSSSGAEIYIKYEWVKVEGDKFELRYYIYGPSGSVAGSTPKAIIQSNKKGWCAIM